MQHFSKFATKGISFENKTKKKKLNHIPFQNTHQTNIFVIVASACGNNGDVVIMDYFNEYFYKIFKLKKRLF